MPKTESEPYGLSWSILEPSSQQQRIRFVLSKKHGRSPRSLARIFDQVYQDCHYAHGGPRHRYVARKRLFTYLWGGKVKKTSYAPRVDNDRVPSPPQPASEEEVEDLEIRIYYDSDNIAKSLREHDPALRLADHEDDA